ncbi:MAG: hypothetical protein R2789_13995 [Microthrixaceae bacterium]
MQGAGDPFARSGLGQVILGPTEPVHHRSAGGTRHPEEDHGADQGEDPPVEPLGEPGGDTVHQPQSNPCQQASQGSVGESGGDDRSQLPHRSEPQRVVAVVGDPFGRHNGHAEHQVDSLGDRSEHGLR